MKPFARLGTAFLGLMLGSIVALMSGAPASAATFPLLGGIKIIGGSGSYTSSYSGNYSGSNCGTIDLLSHLGLDIGAYGKYTSMYNASTNKSIDEITAQVDTNGDGRADKTVKVGKDRLQGKWMGSGVYGGYVNVGGQQKYWLSTGDSHWNIINSYASVCGGVAVKVLLNCICGYGMLNGGQYGYGSSTSYHNSGGYNNSNNTSHRYEYRWWNYSSHQWAYRNAGCNSTSQYRMWDNNRSGWGSWTNCRGNNHNGGYDHNRENNGHQNNGNGNGNGNNGGGNNNGGYNSNQSLPITGTSVATVVGLGLVLASAGAMAIVVTRRRRLAAMVGEPA